VEGTKAVTKRRKPVKSVAMGGAQVVAEGEKTEEPVAVEGTKAVTKRRKPVKSVARKRMKKALLAEPEENITPSVVDTTTEAESSTHVKEEEQDVTT
ncbi:hypothetical protein ACFLTK_04065, partial [Chloroflexota bacterium]